MDIKQFTHDVIDIVNRQAMRRQISIAIICFLLGFLFMTQIKGQMEADRPLHEEADKNLAEIARDLERELSSTKAEAATLKLQLYEARRISDDRSSVLDETKKTKQDLQISAGKVGVEGRGLKIEIKDEKNKLSGADLVDVINELRGSGAEAMAVEGRRVGASTSFNRIGSVIYMDDEKITKPYVVEAIGDPKTLYQAITMPGGIQYTLSLVPGVSMSVRTTNRIVLPTLEARNFDFAKAVKDR